MKIDLVKLVEFSSLLVLLGFSFLLVFQGIFVKAGYFLPTYDNAMLHAGRARVILDTSHWAEMEVVFGGITRSYHLPAYPSLAAGISLLTGLNLLWSIRLIALIFSILLPLSFFLLAKHVSKNHYAGVLAGFFALISYNLMAWGTRTSPISFGVLLVPLVFYFVLKKNYFFAIPLALLIALDHQPSLLVLVLSLTIFLFFSFSEFFLRQKIISFSLIKRFFSESKWVFLVLFIPLVAYLAWHVRLTGFDCLTLQCLPHFSSHEYGDIINLWDYFFGEWIIPRAFGFFGIFWIVIEFSRKRVEAREFILMLSWFVACFLLIKNDVFGIRVFTERFVTYFDEVIAVLGGLFVGSVYAGIYDLLKKRKR